MEVKRFNLTFLQVLAIDKIHVQFSVWHLRTTTATLALIKKCVQRVQLAAVVKACPFEPATAPTPLVRFASNGPDACMLPPLHIQWRVQESTGGACICRVGRRWKRLGVALHLSSAAHSQQTTECLYRSARLPRRERNNLLRLFGCDFLVHTGPGCFGLPIRLLVPKTK